MDLPQQWLETLLGYPIAWGDTAAWLQAIGTLAAIGLAITLDVLARRRARNDRADELDQRRKERGHREDRAIWMRIDAIAYAAAAFEQAAASCESRVVPLGEVALLSATDVQRIRAAEGAMQVVQHMPAEMIHAFVISAVELAIQAAAGARNRLVEQGGIVGPEAWAEQIGIMRNGAKALSAIRVDALAEWGRLGALPDHSP
jgi:hypothetical protein